MGFTNTELLYRDLWEGFREYCATTGTTLRTPLPKAYPQGWLTLPIGRDRFALQVTASVRKERIGCELYLFGDTARSALELLAADKDAIERELGALEWIEPAPSKKECRIARYRYGIAISNPETWPDAYAWFKREAEHFYAVFAPRVKRLPREFDGSES